jgi:hypothetical protein
MDVSRTNVGMEKERERDWIYGGIDGWINIQLIQFKLTRT